MIWTLMLAIKQLAAMLSSIQQIVAGRFEEFIIIANRGLQAAL